MGMQYAGARAPAERRAMLGLEDRSHGAQKADSAAGPRWCCLISVLCPLFSAKHACGVHGAGRGRAREKGIWWMPWHREAMKDVARCEKPRGGASARGSSDLRMGQPTALAVSSSESIAWRGEPGELNHLSSRRKGHQSRLR